MRVTSLQKDPISPMSNHHFHICRSFIAAASLALAAGTGIAIAAGSSDAGSEVLAKVGPRTITRSEFEEVFAKQYRPSSASIDSARQRFLESLVHKELLVLEAKTRGLYDSTPVKAQTDQFRRDELGARVRQDEAEIDSTITDKELAESHQRSLKEIKLRHIIHWNQASIDSARKRIAGGESFAQVAREVTIDKRGVETGGELPWLNGLQIIKEFRPYVDPLAIGGISKPFQSYYGWHLVQLDSVRDRTSEGMEAERDLVIRQILDDRTRRTRLDHQAKYQENYKYEIDRAATIKTMEEAKASFEAAFADTSRAGLPLGEQWAAADSNAVLARYTGGTVTVAEYRHRLLDGTYINMDALWGRVAPAPALNDVRERFYEEVRLVEAKKRGYDQDEELLRRVELKHEEYAVDAVYMQSIDPHLHFTDEELKKYYEAHTESFPRAEFYRCARIVVNDADVAKGLVSRMPGVEAAAFDSLAAEIERSGHLLRADRDTGRQMPVEPDPVMEAARNMKPGEVGYVIDTDGNHIVFVLIEHEPEGIESFEDARGRVQTTLYNVVSEEKLTALLKELETRYSVEVYPDRLQAGKS